jgi:hypothetical protein
MLRKEQADGITNILTWRKFTDSVKRQIEVASQTILNLSYDDYPRQCICAYGASGRAAMWLNACGFDDRVITYVIDESPLRIGKLMPGTHQEIVMPDHFRKDRYNLYCLVTAWNYFEQIRQKHLDYKGIWILPSPELRFV